MRRNAMDCQGQQLPPSATSCSIEERASTKEACSDTDIDGKCNRMVYQDGATQPARHHAVEAGAELVKNEVIAEGPPALADEEAMELSTDDWIGMHKTTWQMKLWRAYPAWAIPEADLVTRK
eukprot:3361954-Pyramimonas_sp.AAC.1